MFSTRWHWYRKDAISDNQLSLDLQAIIAVCSLLVASKTNENADSYMQINDYGFRNQWKCWQLHEHQWVALDLSAIIAACSQFSRDLSAISAVCQQLSHARRCMFSRPLLAISDFCNSLASTLKSNFCRPHSYKYGFVDFGARCQSTFSRPLCYNCSFHPIFQTS